MNLSKSKPPMSETRCTSQVSFCPPDSKNEKNLDLFLPAVVSGIDAEGNEFKEKTELSSMSSLTAQFGLMAKVAIGTKLHVVLDIPKTFILENKLKMRISGDVIVSKSDPGSGNKHLISLHLDKTYKIHPIKT